MADATATVRFEIGPCVLDFERGVLERSGTILPVRAKTFALLLRLARSAGHVVAMADLLDAVWPDTIVTEDSLTQAVKDARRVLGDDDQAWLRTVPKRGYLLVCTPRTVQAPAFDRATWSRPCNEPVLAVLPFGLQQNEPEARLLFDGLADEITHALACFRSVTVLARASAFAFPPDTRPDPVS
ncbi:winged helix-turn-helix domain-containing protein, partial [Nostoc sp. NIES-2111]